VKISSLQLPAVGCLEYGGQEITDENGFLNNTSSGGDIAIIVLVTPRTSKGAVVGLDV